jgi:dihydroflavonol-4-reductase
MSGSAFVTGGTGLLGTNLVRELARQGWKVKVLARSRAKLDRILHGIELDAVSGDMEDVAGFAPTLQGCDTLFHCAAYFREYYSAGQHQEKLERINVRGTIELLDAAERAGLRKVVYVSSAGVLGLSGSSGTIDESAPYALETSNLYFRSKIDAEWKLFDWLRSHSTPVVLILPGWMFGPFDEAPTASGRLVQDFLARKLPAMIPGGANVVDARDVAMAMIRSVEQGRPGERYIVAGPPVSLEEIAVTLERVTGIPTPRLRLPYSAALVVAWLSQTAAALRGAHSLLTVSGVRTMRESTKHALSSAKAQRELGASFRSLSETLQDEVNWFRGVDGSNIR